MLFTVIVAVEGERESSSVTSGGPARHKRAIASDARAGQGEGDRRTQGDCLLTCFLSRALDIHRADAAIFRMEYTYRLPVTCSRYTPCKCRNIPYVICLHASCHVL